MMLMKCCYLCKVIIMIYYLNGLTAAKTEVTVATDIIPIAIPTRISDP